MPGRKNKLLFIICILIVSMNVFAITHVVATANNQIEGNTTSVNTMVAPTIEDAFMPFVPSAEDDIPDLKVWDLEINVTRVIKLHDFGYITINDTFSIIKQDNLTLPIFRFAYTNDWVEKMNTIEGRTMWDIEGLQRNATTVSEEYKNDNYTFYVMALNPVINNNSKYTISVQASFFMPFESQNHVDTDGFLRNGVLFNTSWVPLLTAPIKKSTCSFSTSSQGGIWVGVHWPINATEGESAVVYGDTWNVPSHNFTADYDINEKFYPYRVRVGGWLAHFAPAEATSYKRTVILDNWLWAKVHEEITIVNLGARPNEELYDLLNSQIFLTFALQRLHFYIDNAEDVKVYDHLGDLDDGLDKSEPIVQLNRINAWLRVPVYGGDTVSFKIDYKLRLEDILSFEKSEFILNTLAMPKVEFHVRNFELELIFPQGSNFQYISMGDESVDYTLSKTGVMFGLGRRDLVTIQLEEVSYFDNIKIRAGYYMSDIAYFIQPLIFALIIFLACLLYIGIRTLRKDVIDKVIITSDTREEIPIDLIQSFVEKHEEKSALQIRIRSLDENRRKKKVKAKEYDKQKKILESKQREVILQLDNTKKELKQISRKYYDVIQKIEINEEKKISIERSIKDLRIRYIREKQISKDAYLKLLKDYKNQITKFERDVDREIINLRLLIEHESKE
ncbi:MAG: hypothetical protein ACTSO7_07410 [Candidatus Heimdallarchaeota archaeon]